MKAPEDWTPDDLHLHLQHAVDLELWTIPLYLSAVYSIAGLETVVKKGDYPEVAKLILSVVIQEMLHLEIIANLSLALGHKPEFRNPEYLDHQAIPFIVPNKSELPEELQDFEVAIRQLDKQQIKLFCVIEFPHEGSDLPWSEKEGYDSIGELYGALREGVTALWEKCYTPGAQIAPQFMGYTRERNAYSGFSQEITSLDAAMAAINAIVAQGEGISHGAVSRDFQPPANLEGAFDPGWFEPTLSHYEKFRIILANKYLPPVYTQPVKAQKTIESAQRSLSNNLTAVLNALNSSFSPDNDGLSSSFYSTMFKMSNSIREVWKTGGIPDFSK